MRRNCREADATSEPWPQGCGIILRQRTLSPMADVVMVTGGAGFIGSAVVRTLIHDTDARVVVIDKLTYAGHLEWWRTVMHGRCDGARLGARTS